MGPVHLAKETVDFDELERWLGLEFQPKGADTHMKDRKGALEFISVFVLSILKEISSFSVLASNWF